tara:strand:+ start:1551 stop:2237 length:687 start_codon:yes stop_codon:yes gene_type:complete
MTSLPTTEIEYPPCDRCGKCGEHETFRLKDDDTKTLLCEDCAEQYKDLVEDCDEDDENDTCDECGAEHIKGDLIMWTEKDGVTCHDLCEECYSEKPESNVCEGCGTHGGDALITHSFGCVALCEACSYNVDGEPTCPRTHKDHESDPCDFCVDAWIQHDIEKHLCCICSKPYGEYGNNPLPLCENIMEDYPDSRCCDECNVNVVIARIRASFASPTSSLRMVSGQPFK